MFVLLKGSCVSLAWWSMPLIPAPRRQRQEDPWIPDQPGLHRRVYILSSRQELHRKTLSQTNKQSIKQTNQTKKKTANPFIWTDIQKWVVSTIISGAEKERRQQVFELSTLMKKGIRWVIQESFPRCGLCANDVITMVTRGIREWEWERSRWESPGLVSLCPF